jgi:hypothetical protein
MHEAGRIDEADVLAELEFVLLAQQLQILLFFWQILFVEYLSENDADLQLL